jgi:hypothetical protein
LVGCGRGGNSVRLDTGCRPQSARAAAGRASPFQSRYPHGNDQLWTDIFSPDDRAGEIISTLPDVRDITAAVIDALPGEEGS